VHPILREQASCHNAPLRRMAVEQWVSSSERMRVIAALLCVTTAQEGRVSDVRTPCHIDVEGMMLKTLPPQSSRMCLDRALA
jgi:hypothetical protein